MNKEKLAKLTNEELRIEKKKLEKSKMKHAVAIGFLAGIAIFGIVAWSMSPNRQVGFLIPLLIPFAIVYKLIKNSKNHKELEDILRERGI